MLKQAGFIENTFQGMKDELSQGGMFEKIFSIMGPSVAWSFFKPLGALLMLAEVAGIGPGVIGRWLDQKLNPSDRTDMSFDESQLKDASGSIIDTLLSKVGLKSTSSLNDIFMVKGHLDQHDLVSAAALCKYGFEKQALGRSRLLSTVKEVGKTSLTGMLVKLLLMFVVGLAGVGLAKGVIGATGDFMKAPTSFPSSGTMPSGTLSGATKYANTKENVEDTIIHFLDSAYKVRGASQKDYKTFSEMFHDNNGYALKGSDEMNSVLNTINTMNVGGIEQANEKKSFFAPNLETIAKILLPTFKLESEPIKEKTLSTDSLTEALRGIYK